MLQFWLPAGVPDPAGARPNYRDFLLIPGIVTGRRPAYDAFREMVNVKPGIPAGRLMLPGGDCAAEKETARGQRPAAPDWSSLFSAAELDPGKSCNPAQAAVDIAGVPLMRAPRGTGGVARFSTRAQCAWRAARVAR